MIISYFSQTQIEILVDGVHKEGGSTHGHLAMLSSNVVYVAGSPNTAELPGSKISSNFVGCLRKVRGAEGDDDDGKRS